MYQCTFFFNDLTDSIDRYFTSCIQLFRERLSEKMCTRQFRKVTWDMINTLFLAIVAVEFICQCFPFSTRKHMSMASSDILSNFCEEK